MNQKEPDEKNQIICEFRYGIIADLTNPYLDPGEIKKLIYEKSLREYEIPFSSKTTIGSKTILNWLSNYLKCGKNGLHPKTRNDFGKSKCLTETEQSALIEYLEGHPEITATTALKVLRNKGIIRSRISESSLSRFVIANGLTREKRLEKKEAVVSLPAIQAGRIPSINAVSPKPMAW